MEIHHLLHVKFRSLYSNYTNNCILFEIPNVMDEFRTMDDTIGSGWNNVLLVS
jgi:hypothetical protein